MVVMNESPASTSILTIRDHGNLICRDAREPEPVAPRVVSNGSIRTSPIPASIQVEAAENSAVHECFNRVSSATVTSCLEIHHRRPDPVFEPVAKIDAGRLLQHVMDDLTCIAIGVGHCRTPKLRAFYTLSSARSAHHASMSSADSMHFANVAP